MTVFRLFAAIALYIQAFLFAKFAVLEFYVNRFFSGFLLVITKTKELANFEAKHTSNNIAWECLNFSRKITNTTIIKTTRCLDLILGINEFLLQLNKVLACL